MEAILYVVGLVLIWVIVNVGTNCLLDWLCCKAETQGTKWKAIYHTVAIVLLVLFLGILVITIYRAVGGV